MVTDGSSALPFPCEAYSRSIVKGSGRIFRTLAIVGRNSPISYKKFNNTIKININLLSGNVFGSRLMVKRKSVLIDGAPGVLNKI